MEGFVQMNPKYPIYIVSKGRWETRLTSITLEEINVPYRIVIEPTEYEQYASVIDKNKILVLPFDNLGLGSTPARNWIWEHSIQEGHERHWVLDDNIKGFYRYHNSLKYKVTSGTVFKCIEDFTDRYTNVGLSGFQYLFFASHNRDRAAFILNTRVYSCILINNKLPLRWRGKYNEDSDLSIRALKDGYCNILFNAFLQGKQATMKMAGGNEEIYAETDNRKEFVESLMQQHPDVVKIIRKYGRWHHSINFNHFKKNKLIKKVWLPEYPKINNYGMVLKTINNEK